MLYSIVVKLAIDNHDTAVREIKPKNRRIMVKKERKENRISSSGLLLFCGFIYVFLSHFVANLVQWVGLYLRFFIKKWQCLGFCVGRWRSWWWCRGQQMAAMAEASATREFLCAMQITCRFAQEWMQYVLFGLYQSTTLFSLPFPSQGSSCHSGKNWNNIISFHHHTFSINPFLSFFLLSISFFETSLNLTPPLSLSGFYYLFWFHFFS